MSLFKVINIIILLGFLNTITYFPCYVYFIDHTEASIQAADKSVDFDGDTLLECLLDDVLDIPSSGDSGDPIIFFDDFNFLIIVIVLVAKMLESFFLAIKPLITALQSQENYFFSKITPLVGYYTFLFRLKPF